MYISPIKYDYCRIVLYQNVLNILQKGSNGLLIPNDSNTIFAELCGSVFSEQEKGKAEKMFDSDYDGHHIEPDVYIYAPEKYSKCMTENEIAQGDSQYASHLMKTDSIKNIIDNHGITLKLSQIFSGEYYGLDNMGVSEYFRKLTVLNNAKITISDVSFSEITNLKITMITPAILDTTMKKFVTE